MPFCWSNSCPEFCVKIFFDDVEEVEDIDIIYEEI
jgi:hypothetical protein